MKFEDKIKQRLKGLNNKQLCRFAWLCGVRTLPILSVIRKFTYWSMEDRQEYLYSIFYALDVSALIAFLDDSVPNIDAANAAADAANIAANDIRVTARTAANATRAARTVASAARAAINAARSAVNDNNTVYAASAAYAAVSESYSTDFINTHDWENILFNDIEAIRKNKIIECDHDTDVYNILWNRFQEDLHAIGCAYWARFYENLFNNCFIIDRKQLIRHFSVPDEIKADGAAAVGRYLEGLGDKKERFNEVRIIILGEKGAGKTSLARKLLNIDSPIPKDVESTESVVTSLWRFPGKNGTDVNAYVWDFAGFSIIHAVHRCFMSARCLYIYVYNGHIERDNDPAYWLEQIRIYGGDSPVLFLINEKDNHRADIAEKTLKNEYPSIVGYYRIDISSKDKTKLENFRQTVMDTVCNNSSLNSQIISMEVYKIRNELHKHFNETKASYITLEKFNEIARKCRASAGRFEDILNDLNTLGICFWYNKPEMEDFNTIVLNPDWITNGIYRIIYQSYYEHQYKLTTSKGTEILKNDDRYKYPFDKVEFLFKLMRLYELAFFENTDNIFIPGILPIDRPDGLPTFDDSNNRLTMSFDVEKVLPPGIMARIIVKRSDEIFDEKLLWRKGAVLRYKGSDTIALIIEENRSITVSVKGMEKTAYITSLRETIQAIFDDYKGIKPVLSEQNNNPINIWISVIKIILDNGYSNAVEFRFENYDILDDIFFSGEIISSKETKSYGSSNIFFKAKLWQLLSINRFTYEVNNSDELGLSDDNVVDNLPDIENKNIANTDEKSAAPVVYQDNKEKGARLEDMVLALFEELFIISDDAKHEILTKIRKQNSGNQFGFDIEVQYFTQYRKTVECRIECKNHSNNLSLKDVSDKIEQLRYGNKEFDHYIIICPTSNPVNELNEHVKYWKNDNSLPFTIQIWSKETFAKKFFALNANIYFELYGTHCDDINRNDVLAEFKERLKPQIKLSPAWKDYILNAEKKLLLHKEQEYPTLFRNYVEMNAIDADGLPISIGLFDYVYKWLHDKKDKCLFLLGEFGDGKTFFTYYLSRRLIEEYSQSPKHGWIPIRFALHDFSKEGVYNVQEFIKRRLELFGADLSTYRDICRNNRVFVILDGFDEMSQKIDKSEINKNIRRLLECYKEFNDENFKVLITSRKHFFMNNEDTVKLLSRLDNPALIQLAPIARKDVRVYLDIEGNKEVVTKLQSLHDPIGLATKPLFMDMLKVIIKELPADNLDENKIYEIFIKKSLLERKFDDQLDDSNLKLTPNEIYDRLLIILESFALELHKTDAEYISFDQYFNSKSDKNIAEHLWSLSAPSEEENEDASQRIVHRSLLIRPNNVNDKDRRVNFCHRSMREYFIAKAIYRMLLNNEHIDCRNFLKDYDLNREMIFFVSQMIKSDSQEKQDKCIKILNGFIKETYNRNTVNNPDRRKYERLGSHSLNITFSTLNKLPEDDYSHLILDGAYLESSDLSTKNFSHTSMRNSTLYNVNFDNSDFSYADITGALIDKTPRVVSVSCPGNDENLYALYEDGSVWKWNANTYRGEKYINPKSNEKNMYSHVLALPNGYIAIIEHGKTNAISFYKNRSMTGAFNIDDSVKVVNANGNLLVLQEDSVTGKQGAYKYSAYNILNNNTFSIETNSRPLCVSLDTQAIITYYGSDLKINDKEPIASITDIKCMASSQFNDGFAIALGRKTGEILAYSAVKSDKGWNVSKRSSLKTFNSDITHMTFIDKEAIAVVAGGESIHIFKIDESFCLTEKNINQSLKIDISCKGMKINGLKSAKEYEFLSRQIGSS
jgi:GTPase SAR1 family protein